MAGVVYDTERETMYGIYGVSGFASRLGLGAMTLRLLDLLYDYCDGAEAHRQLGGKDQHL